MGRRFRTKAQHLKQVEWRTALELPYELVSREARAADLIIAGARHTSSESTKGNRKPPKDIFPMSRATFAAMELSWGARCGGKRGGRSRPNSCISFKTRVQI
jgi:hypothetical protein